jgi:Phage integrase, N-terminal SAM-like domain
MSSQPKTVSPLRQRMIEDMRMRKLAPQTQTAYIRAVRKFARYLNRAPDTATAEDLRNFQLHLLGHKKLDYLPRRTMSRPVAAPLGKGENGDASGNICRHGHRLLRNAGSPEADRIRDPLAGIRRLPTVRSRQRLSRPAFYFRVPGLLPYGSGRDAYSRAAQRRV